MENFTSENQHFYIFVEWKNGTTAHDILQKLVNAGGDGVLSLKTIRHRVNKFNHRIININDEPRSGRPHTAVTPILINKIKDIVNKDKHITTRKISDAIGISKERVSYTLHNELSLRKLCKKWIPHVLTEENKLKRVEYSRKSLETLNKGYKNIITGDETWLHSYTIASKEDNKVWLRKGANRLQIVRTAQSSKKYMFCIFFSAEGIVDSFVVPKGTTITGRFYANKILPNMLSNYKKNNGKNSLQELTLHHDNASSHTCRLTKTYLENQGISNLPHPPYSPDLAPCDFFLFPKIKKELKNKKYDHVENLARAVQAVTSRITLEDYHNCFETWKKRLQKFIDNNGLYFEGMK